MPAVGTDRRVYFTLATFRCVVARIAIPQIVFESLSKIYALNATAMVRKRPSGYRFAALRSVIAKVAQMTANGQEQKLTCQLQS